MNLYFITCVIIQKLKRNIKIEKETWISSKMYEGSNKPYNKYITCTVK